MTRKRHLQSSDHLKRFAAKLATRETQEPRQLLVLETEDSREKTELINNQEENARYAKGAVNYNCFAVEVVIKSCSLSFLCFFLDLLERNLSLLRDSPSNR